MATEPKIELIVTELMGRIKAVYPRVFVQRGFFADENTIWPAIYVDEDIESSSIDRINRRGLYDRKASLNISYFFKGPTDLIGALRIANIEKFKLCTAIETDDDFAGLCNLYGEVECDKVFYKANGIQIAIQYSFEYSEESPWATANARRM